MQGIVEQCSLLVALTRCYRLLCRVATVAYMSSAIGPDVSVARVAVES